MSETVYVFRLTLQPIKQNDDGRRMNLMTDGQRLFRLFVSSTLLENIKKEKQEGGEKKGPKQKLSVS